MIFLDYASMQPWLYPIAGVVLAVAFGKLANGQRRPIFYVFGSLCVLSSLLTAAMTLLVIPFGVLFEQTTQSAPIYSPDHSSAVIVSNADSGALGGSTYIQLYAKHGFVNYLVFVGDYAQTDRTHVRWLDGNRLEISFWQSRLAPRCSSNRFVTIVCTPLLPSANPH